MRPRGANWRISARVMSTGVDFAVDLKLPHPPGNELGVLGAEIQDQDFLFMRIGHMIFE